jgi:hypothetical protein
VDLVDHHITQSAEKGLPVTVVREQGQVEHFRVGEQDPGGLSRIFLRA